MANRDEETVQDLAKDYPGPPAYDESELPPASQQSQAPPSYEKQASNNHATTSSPYGQFPPVMNAYCEWNVLKSFNLCGATKEDRLYVVDIHTGYSAKGPLGSKAGIILHNGLSTKDPILAAAGDESMFAAHIFAFNVNSIIMLPPLEDDRARHRAMTTEMMRPSAMSKDGIAFIFSVEVGEKLRRERFEWRKFKKGDGGDEASPGGFKLLRLPSSPKNTDSNTGGSSKSKGNGDSLLTGNDGEVVAVLTLTRSWAKLKHPFSLELTGSALSGALGERWTLMTVITAIRMSMLDINGRASKISISMSEKLGAK
ncbi:hypothetical protein V490_06781 [Pseudogymnoascus sp. VKM F-3557]|nr:hypothetical protein V490_06781 [Pseudogymnoascus sp. VKM F-3557]